MYYLPTLGDEKNPIMYLNINNEHSQIGVCIYICCINTSIQVIKWNTLWKP